MDDHQRRCKSLSSSSRRRVMRLVAVGCLLSSLLNFSRLLLQRHYDDDSNPHYDETLSFRAPLTRTSSTRSSTMTPSLPQQQQQQTSAQQHQPPPKEENVGGNKHKNNKRVLYIVTSMREFDDGERNTISGNDRFSNTLVPLIRQAVDSMTASGYHVDLYLIAYYSVTSTRRTQIQSVLPESCQLEVWDDAAPLSYARDHSETVLEDITRGLARQHRYVIKDKLLYYDIFVSFEDDMLIKGAHVEHFVNVTQELYNLRQDALETFPDKNLRPKHAMNIFHGEMTLSQLERMLPGFIRVEVALDRNFRPPQKRVFPNIPVDYIWKDKHATAHVDPSYCCHLDNTSQLSSTLDYYANHSLPLTPSRDRIYFWETSIEALGVRKLPERSTGAWDWVIRQAGSQGDFANPKFVIGDYWTGRDHAMEYFAKSVVSDETTTPTRPKLHEARYLNNQGGWMATRRQLVEMHTQQCVGGFLPPYDLPEYINDGLDLKSVEYWSGGISIFGPRSCNMQRILTLEPTGFSKHLLYHTANNKQKAVYDKFYGHSIDEFWGQMNTVRKNAERHIERTIKQHKHPKKKNG